MIRPLNDEEKIEFSKLRLDHPYKLLWGWIFGVSNVTKDIEYIFDADNRRAFCIKIIFCIPIYFIVGIYKIIEFILTPFNLDIEFIFEFICGFLILNMFGFFRMPYAIYTYMRFSRATALIYILKSD